MPQCEFVDEMPSPIPRPTQEQRQCMINARLLYLEQMSDCASGGNPCGPCCEAAGHVYRSNHLGCFYS